MRRIGMIGLGAIGSFLAERISAMPQYQIVAVAELSMERYAAVQRRIPVLPLPCGIPELVTRADIVIEAAGKQVVGEVLRACTAAKRDCILLSSGGLLEHLELLQQANRAGIHVLIPSGALAGIDALRAAKLGRIDAVTLTSTKHPSGFADAPYVQQRGIDMRTIDAPTVLFEGNALDAVHGFPQNVNVAATLSLYGIGPMRTRVRIIADPAVQVNQHEVRIEGDFGVISTKTENIPSPENPKTSALAALSALSMLTEPF